MRSHCNGSGVTTVERALGTRGQWWRPAWPRPAARDALLDAGVAAGPIFVTAFLAQGALRADYSQLRHPVSSLALGTGGWVQTTNFCLAGGLYLAGAVGLARRWRGGGGADVGAAGRCVPALVGAAAVGLIGAGLFVTDP